MNNEILLFVMVVLSCYLIVVKVHYLITTPPKKIVADIYESFLLTLKFWIYWLSLMCLFMLGLFWLGDLFFFVWLFIILIFGLFPKQIKGFSSKRFLRKRAMKIFREMRRVKPIH